MNKIIALTAALTLSGCMQINDYNAVVRAPAPADIAGYWQSVGPQSEMVSPEAIASLIITPDGDTLDCRQWQRTIATPGRLTQRDAALYNVTVKRDFSELERDENHLRYAGMTFGRVNAPTSECASYLTSQPLPSPLP